MPKKRIDNPETSDPRNDNNRIGGPGYREDDQSPHPSRDKSEKRREPETIDSPALDFEPEHVPRPEQNQRYPPIITIDGRVDTDIDHLMDDSEEDKAIEASQRRYPKPHVFSVIEGSIDDDVDSLANHDGTMEHTLVDAPKSFNPRDLKDVSAKVNRRKSPERANCSSLVTDRSDNKQNADVSDIEDDFSRADDTPLTSPHDALPCKDYHIDDTKPHSDRSGADEFGSASKESVRLNPKTPPLTGKSFSKIHRLGSKRPPKKTSSNKEKKVAPSDRLSVKTNKKYDFIDQETQNESALAGNPYNKPTGFYTTYGDSISTDDIGAFSGCLSVTSISKCTCSPESIRKAMSTGDAEDDVGCSANNASDRPLSDGEIVDVESHYSPCTTKKKPGYLQQEFKSYFMQNEAMAHTLANDPQTKHSLLGLAQSNSGVSHTMNCGLTNQAECLGLRETREHQNTRFESNNKNINDTQENSDKSTNRSENMDNDMGPIEKENVWIDRVKPVMTNQNIEIQAAINQSFQNCSSKGDRNNRECTLVRKKQSDTSDRNSSMMGDIQCKSFPAEIQAFKNVRITAETDRCKCKPGVLEPCSLCRSKRSHICKGESRDTFRHSLQKIVDDESNSSIPTYPSAMILENEGPFVLSDIAQKNYTSNRMIPQPCHNQDMPLLSNISHIPLERKLGRVSKHLKPSTIQGSLQAAIQIAEQSMSAAAKVAQVLSFVMEATQASHSFSNSSSIGNDSIGKPRQRSLSPTSSRRSSSFPHQSLSEQKFDKKRVNHHLPQRERSSSPEVGANHPSQRLASCTPRSRSRGGRYRSNTRDGRCRGGRGFKELNKSHCLPKPYTCMACDGENVRMKHTPEHNTEKGRSRRYQNERGCCHKCDLETRTLHESQKPRDKSKSKHFMKCKGRVKYSTRLPVDRPSTDESRTSSREYLRYCKHHRSTPMRHEQWSLPLRNRHASPESDYMSHVAKCWKDYPLIFDKTVPQSTSGYYIRSKIVGTSVDPNERDSEYDSIGFNDNARVYRGNIKEHGPTERGMKEQDYCHFTEVLGTCTKDLRNSELWLVQRPSRRHCDFDDIQPDGEWSVSRYLPHGKHFHDFRRGLNQKLAAGPVPTVDDSYVTCSESEARSTKRNNSRVTSSSASRTTDCRSDDNLSLKTRPYDFNSDAYFQSESTETLSNSHHLEEGAGGDIKSMLKCKLYHRERPRHNFGRKDT